MSAGVRWRALHCPGFGWKAGLGTLLGCTLCAGFVLLGNWQLHRLSWKLQLIHDVQTRVGAPPVPAPGPALWPRIRAGGLRYLHVRLQGHFLSAQQTLVHGTSDYGYGYWVMAPFQTTQGFIALVNRGYVPPELGTPAAADRIAAPAGRRAVTGLLRLSEPGGGLLQANRPAAGQWHSRDVAAIGRARGLPAATLAPYFIDADAGQSTARWPAGGLTRVHFRNAHLGYAITWYVLAVLVLAATGYFLVARPILRPSHPDPPRHAARPRSDRPDQRTPG